ncbi:hypothetical protein C8F04DRAFT_1176865 [Mycena alexandri]|uniref:Uncharacterized protein n=1 Tax=Mycena alexandri TaxID=1745969 RepID=A0AAD6TCF5_9AGAR|nr:hypothetical protein C8F04DRAFT_1176865 [Mycena alexandri]
MPAKRKCFRDRAENFVKHVKEALSPLKKALSPRKKRRIGEKENGKASTSPSEMSTDRPIVDHITEDVFLTTSSNVGTLAPDLYFRDTDGPSGTILPQIHPVPTARTIQIISRDSGGSPR